MADNYTGRAGRPDDVYFNDQLDAVTESDGAGGWRLKTTGTGGDACCPETNTLLTAINNKTPALGAAVTADSVPVVLASDSLVGAVIQGLGTPFFKAVAATLGVPVSVSGFVIGGVVTATGANMTLAQIGGLTAFEKFAINSGASLSSQFNRQIMTGDLTDPHNITTTVTGTLFYLNSSNI